VEIELIVGNSIELSPDLSEARVRGSALFAVLTLIAICLATTLRAASNPDSDAGVTFQGEAPAPAEPLTLWYRRPAVAWTEALPVGNGRLGAMIFGGVNQERLQLNEDTLWAGGPYNPDNTNSLHALPEIRKLIFDGKYDEADKLITATMLGKPMSQMPYETVGDLFLDFTAAKNVLDYERALSLDTATHRVTYTRDGDSFVREVFCSSIDHAIVVRLTANRPGQVSFDAHLKTPQRATVGVEGNDTLVMSGVNGEANGINGALKFQARVRIVTQGGKIAASDNSISVTAADSATLYIVAATSYRNYEDVSGDPEAITKKRLAAVTAKPFPSVLAAHVAEHQRLFRRVSLDLGETEAMKRPTDERIKSFAGGDDPQLAALYFQFGRYLLISCSRPGGQPANLQGLWNDSMSPPWGGKYTININTEMNYWPVDTANLGECIEPLKAMVLDLTKTGARTAKEMYGARGWVVHHNTDLWRASAPIDGAFYGVWPMGGAWLCQTLWDHYLFTEDKAFLKELYPALKGSAQFFLDTLVEEPSHHWLVTCPSLSPENGHPEGRTSVCAGPTMDMQILRDLFSNCIRAAQVLGVDKEFSEQVAAARERLAPMQIGSKGQLQEWLKDWDAQPGTEVHHRHVSHLYGLYPSGQIDVRTTPELAAAVKKSLELRGDKATGWATAWRLDLWTRLHEGDHAYGILQFLLSPERTYPDMFDAHPPFQIDGNFGGTAGIAEMLLQSQNGVIELLPALPKAWPAGSVKGLRARGGFEVSIDWKDGKLERAQIKNENGNAGTVHYAEKTTKLPAKRGKTFELNFNLEAK
jgi:alpha-L-fucosidase 2